MADRPQPENCFESLDMTLAFWSGDWGEDRRLAWIYGIICGWGNGTEEENAALQKEFEVKFHWDPGTWARLQRLHKQYREVSLREGGPG